VQNPDNAQFSENPPRRAEKEDVFGETRRMVILVSHKCCVNLQVILLGTVAACYVHWKERLLQDSTGVLQVNTEVRLQCDIIFALH